MRSTTTTSDGVRLRTSSARRFVVFHVHGDGETSIYRRTDDPARAAQLYGHSLGRAARSVLVDTAAPSCVLADSATRASR